MLPFGEEIAIWADAPGERVYNESAILWRQFPLLFVAEFCESYRNVKAIFIRECVVSGKDQVLGCGKHIHIFLLDEDINFLNCVG